MLVYGATVLITGLWVIQMLQTQKLWIKRTPLDIPVMLFLVSQILSTVFSIDPHTSIWGYYSRSNGGLLSTISYLLLYYALVSNFTKEDIFRLLKFTLAGGLIVALWAIMESQNTFSISPSCVLLVHQFNADCWVQDVKARVFASLGQPNWLAAYLAMLIFPAFYFLVTEKVNLKKIYYALQILAFYLAFTFTYSRGGSLGLIAGGIIFGGIYLFKSASKKEFFFVVISLLIINLLFGSALTDFRLIKQSAPPPRPSIASSVGGTQLETGGTESGTIRLIVWKGALQIFKHYPLFGSGVETFAYSYYNFRPVEHNLVSEWDFLYNKAHNEYLNYLATTGAVGFLSYLGMIGTFMLLSVWYLLFRKKEKHSNSWLFTAAILGSYISYLVQNFFGFSVVIIALFFYTFPGLVFVIEEKTWPLKINLNFFKLPQTFLNTLVQKNPYRVILLSLTIILTLYYLGGVIKYWIADTYYKTGNEASDAGNPGKAYNNLSIAVSLNNKEPLYQNDLGYAAASASLALAQSDATQSASLALEADAYTENSLRISPKNVSLWRTAVRTYYELSVLDPKYEDKAEQTMDQTIVLAPTDPKLYYNKALILSQLGKNEEAVEVMKKAIELKPNYREAYLSLSSLYSETKHYDLAKEEADKVLKMIPNDPDALQRLTDIASESAKVSSKQ